MSDFPELRLLDEVQDLSTSSDFFAFTRDQFNRAWQHESSSSSSDEEQRRTTGLWQTPERLSERSEWDPMLCDAAAGRGGEFFYEATATSQTFPLTCEETPELEEGEDLFCNINQMTEIGVSGAPWLCRQFSGKMEQQIGMDSSTGTITSGPRFNMESFFNEDVETCVEGSNRVSLKKVARGQRNGGSCMPSPRRLKSRKQSSRRRAGRKGGAAAGGGKKVKLYEMPQFRDARRERSRLNAINSKINRDRKKNLLAEAEGAITSLKTINWRLVREAARGRQRLLAARQEIQRLRKQLALDD